MTLEQVPGFLLTLGERIGNIEHLLNQPTLNTVAEKPMSVSEAATFCLLEEPTIYSLVQSRSIPFHKPKKKIYFYASELNEWIRSGIGKTYKQLQSEAESEFLSVNKNKKG